MPRRMASCNIRMTTTPPPAFMEELLTTTKSTVQTTHPSTKPNIFSSTSLGITTQITTSSPSNRMFFSKPSTNIAIEASTKTTLPEKSTVSDIFNMTSISNIDKAIEGTSSMKTHSTFVYNRTETPAEGTSNSMTTAHVTSTTIKIPLTTKTISTRKLSTTSIPALISITTVPTSKTTLGKAKDLPTTTEMIRKTDTIPQFNLTIPKLKPKEIWIKPTQKGISTEFKLKVNNELSHSRINGTKNEISEITTPRTIIVSIIPTSVSHASFKKIALTTASYTPLRTNMSSKKQRYIDQEKTEAGVTKSMSTETSTQAPFTIKILSSPQRNISTPFQQKNFTNAVSKNTPRKTFINTSSSHSTSSTKVAGSKIPTSTVKSTNSMSSTSNSSTVKKILKTSNVLTLRPSTNITSKITTQRTINLKDETRYLKDDIYKTNEFSLQTTTYKSVTTNVTTKLKTHGTLKQTHKIGQKNVTKTISNVLSTETPTEDETFHILTEPEHITAVMSEKEREKSSLDLISVVSVAGGIMMAVITVAVIIVMFERCRRPRYEDVRKINDIRMQVMIDNNDVPPPYVRSIFHTPLPDPPQSEKCHYQPISTLDRNLKQFMRPVVVQNISPIMLENFRGILECHYDHLPRRSHDIGIISTRSSIAPSIIHDEKPHSARSSSTDYTIDALKCEAKLDAIDNTSSEPLYAEIPCWRPPSEHAIEVMNLNGEAMTEL
ncbi:cell wall protein DAN4-like isoform X2 [Zerene cesonia]|uniref:cell wall protein DAN4-like isoform X2 n=1 Tax=Zerene cesonia TaxID=33412 RepID=UPI0018E50E9B|nr:cell wall protein DAN4-like isoform X2 [Zerene cesonia]